MTRRIVGRPSDKAEPSALDKKLPPQPPIVNRQKQASPNKASLTSRNLADPPASPDRSNQPRDGESFGTEFLDNIAHQMVAPLQSIASHCSNIVQGIVPEERRQMRLEEVIGHARILCELAQRMRFLHELVSGKSIGSETLEFKNITTTWIDCFNNYLSISRFTRESVKIDKYKMNALPDIIGSRLPAQQIVMNLYDNASKYGLDGNVVIRAWRDGDYVVNEFAHDAAVRLTQDAIEQMFSTRGYRSPEARQIRASGTGIGMWISKQLMLAMGGDILASPTGPDGMTRFKLYWRISQ